MANDITKYVTIDNIVYLLKKLKQSGFFVASEKYIGGIKLGYEKTGTRRPVQLDESDKAYVELWTDENQTGTVGKSNQPIYFDKGEPNPIEIKSGDSNTENPLLVNAANDPNGIWDTGGRDKGDNTTVKGKQITANFNRGTLTAPGGFRGKLINDDYSNVNVGQDVQDDVQLVYFKDGKPTVPEKKVGMGAASDTAAQAIFVQGGHLKPILRTVGSATKPIYMEKGVFTVGTSTVGSATKPIYLKNGELTAGTSTVGSTTKPVYLKNGELTACDDIVYTTGIKVDGEPDPNLTTPNDVGGIKKGTPLVDQTIDGKVKKGLNGKSFSELFDDLLFPTVKPTYTAPSASISWKSGFQTVYEKGSSVELTVGTGSTTTIKTSFSKGAITLNGVRQNNRSGNLSSGFVYVNDDINNKTLPTTVPLGDTTFKYRASYAEGPQPYNNKGGTVDADGNALTKLPAGSVDSSAITLNGTYPWYAPTATMGTWTKQPLISWKDTAIESDRAGVTLQPHSDNATPQNKQGFKFPRPTGRNTTIKIEVYNTSAKAWEDATHTFTIGTDETINGITYKFYYASMTVAINARKFRVTF